MHHSVDAIVSGLGFIPRVLDSKPFKVVNAGPCKGPDVEPQSCGIFGGPEEKNPLDKAVSSPEDSHSFRRIVDSGNLAPPRMFYTPGRCTAQNPKP